jgi:RNA-directed DNA polymerase
MHSDTIRRAIETEARKRLAKRERTIRESRHAAKAFRLRTGLKPKASKALPFSSFPDKQFDPRYCLSHATFLARCIARSIKEKKYAPRPAYQLDIPKLSGGTRTVSVFSIPDAAVSNVLARRLIRRNQKRFSPSSFAYRADRGPLDAVIQIKAAAQSARAFITEIDFAGYFDNIEHSHVFRTIEKYGFSVTPLELEVLRRFLTYRYHKIEFGQIGPEQRNRTGTPQGTSISLFISNAAAHPLDVDVGNRNGVFVRFADDSVAITFSYDDANALYGCFLNYSDSAVMPINHKKSSPASLFSASSAEIATKPSFSFLGYSFDKSKEGGVILSIAPAKVRAIKRRIGRIIFRHLLLYPRAGHFNSSRIGGDWFDWDLITCINSIRRYVYSGLSQNEIIAAAKGFMGQRRPRGLMAYFCLVENRDLLKELDGWLISVLERALRERKRVLLNLGHSYEALSWKDLTDAHWYHGPFVIDVRIPSFFFAWKASNVAWTKHGPQGINMPTARYGYTGDER